MLTESKNIIDLPLAPYAWTVCATVSEFKSSTYLHRCITIDRVCGYANNDATRRRSTARCCETLVLVDFCCCFFFFQKLIIVRRNNTMTAHAYVGECHVFYELVTFTAVIDVRRRYDFDGGTRGPQISRF